MLSENFFSNNETIIHINSKDCVKNNGNTNDITLKLNTPIDINEKEEFRIELLSCTLPYSWYSINYSNKYLDVREINSNGISTTFSVIVNEGNYNIQQFLNLLQQQLNTNSPNHATYSLLYDKYTNKCNISVSGLYSSSLLFNSGTNSKYDCQYILGFKNKIDVTLPSISDSVCNINPYSNVYINLMNVPLLNSYESKTGGNSLVLAKVPVDTSPFGYIFHKNLNFISYKSGSTAISTIRLVLTDEEGDYIDLNNSDWYCSLRVWRIRHNKVILRRDENGEMTIVEE